MTVGLIVLNVVVFLLDRLTAVRHAVDVVTPVGVIRTYESVGGLSSGFSMIPVDVVHTSGGWLTIFTSMFLHANLLHIGGNMLYLWIFGNNIEDSLGKLRFLLFYLAVGAAGAGVHVLTNPQSDVPTIGASGAVAGVMGAYLVLFPNARILALVPIFIVSTLMEVPAVLVIGFWAVLQFLNTNWLGGGELRGGGVAYGAHVGGFVAGIVLIMLLGGRNLVDRGYSRRYDPGW